MGDWQRPPPPILRVPNTKKHFLASRKVIQTNFCSLSSPKSAIFCQKCAKICHFLARNRFFRPGGDFQDPPPLFQGCPMQQKRVTGAKECTWTSFGSLSPPKCHIFRQKSAKINFGMSLLHKIIGVTAQWPRHLREARPNGRRQRSTARQHPTRTAGGSRRAPTTRMEPVPSTQQDGATDNGNGRKPRPRGLHPGTATGHAKC